MYYWGKRFDLACWLDSDVTKITLENVESMVETIYLEENLTQTKI